MAALIAPFAASAFGTFLLRQAFLAVPEALEDAARLDGCAGLAFLWHVLLPLSRPTVLAFTLVALVAHWNDYFWPLIVTNRDEIRTLPIGLAMFVTQEVTTDWNLLMAATLFVAAPMLVIFFLTQRYFIRSHMHAGLEGCCQDGLDRLADARYACDGSRRGCNAAWDPNGRDAMIKRRTFVRLLAAAPWRWPQTAVAAEPVQLSFWYPVDLGGGLAKVIDGMVADFNKAHPDIHVTATYTGNYDVTLQKIQAAKLAGTLPDVAVTEISSVPVLAALGAAQPLDDLIAGSGGKQFLDRFWPSMLLNCGYNGKIYGVPFQRSTPVMYYNKDAFAAAGLDPEKPPLTWDELATPRKNSRRGRAIASHAGASNCRSKRSTGSTMRSPIPMAAKR